MFHVSILNSGTKQWHHAKYMYLNGMNLEVFLAAATRSFGPIPFEYMYATWRYCRLCGWRIALQKIVPLVAAANLHNHHLCITRRKKILPLTQD